MVNAPACSSSLYPTHVACRLSAKTPPVATWTMSSPWQVLQLHSSVPRPLRRIKPACAPELRAMTDQALRHEPLLVAKRHDSPRVGAPPPHLVGFGMARLAPRCRLLPLGHNLGVPGTASPHASVAASGRLRLQAHVAKLSGHISRQPLHRLRLADAVKHALHYVLQCRAGEQARGGYLGGLAEELTAVLLAVCVAAACRFALHH